MATKPIRLRRRSTTLQANSKSGIRFCVRSRSNLLKQRMIFAPSRSQFGGSCASVALQILNIASETRRKSDAILTLYFRQRIEIFLLEQGEGPLVLLCHGWPELSYSWRHQLQALAAAGFHVVAPDMRGFGRNSAPAEVSASSHLDHVGRTV